MDGMAIDVEGNGRIAKGFKRRRLEDLSFSSPGPAFVGTPSSSDAGDEDSDAGARKRPARIRKLDKSGTTTPLVGTSDSSIDNSAVIRPREGKVPSHPPPLSEAPRQPSLFRNFNAPPTIFRNFDSSRSPVGAKKKTTLSFPTKSRSLNRGKHSTNGGSISHDVNDKSQNGGSKSHSNYVTANGPSAQLIPSSTRESGPSETPTSITRNGKEAHHTSPSKSSPHSANISSSQTKREHLLQRKKEEIDLVYREHDELVRELFHLTKFVTYFGFDPETAAQDRSDVFERFRMDYDLPTKLSGGSGRATRRLVSAKRGDLELQKAVEKKERFTLTKVITSTEASDSPKLDKGKQKAEVTLKVKKGPGRPRKSSAIVVNASSDDSSSSSSDAVQVPLKVARPRIGKKRANGHDAIQSSSESPVTDQVITKRPVGRPRKRAASVEYIPRAPVILERIEGVPRMRVMQPSHLPPRPKYGGSLASYLQSWHTSGEFHSGGIGEMEIVPLSVLHHRERRDAYFYNAIDQARAEGLLQDRDEAARKSLQNRASEPQRVATLWDSLLHGVTVESSRKRIELRNKMAICKRTARMVLLYWDEKLGRGEKQRKIEERRIRAMAKYVVREVRKEWKMAVTIVKAQRAKLEKLEKDRVGREQLKTILEQSTQMLGKQHRVLVQGEADLEEESGNDTDMDNNGSDESDSDSFSEEEMSDLSGNEDVEGSITDDTKQEDAKDSEENDMITPTQPSPSHQHLMNEISHEDEGGEENRSMIEVLDADGAPTGEVDHFSEIESETGKDVASKDADASSLSRGKDELDDAVKIKPPFLLRGTLRPYQQIGFEWLANLYNNGSNGILADEMGLGKTIQTIALLAHLACDKGEWGPHLVIAPTSVMLNWEVEFKKFFPAFKILSYYGSQKERKEKRRGWNSENHFNVCITSYQLVLADQHILRRKAWQYLILDEAHHIKNFKSQRWQTLLGFNSKRRLLLTGTPLQNNLMDLWSLMYFLMPNGVTSADGVVNSGFASMKEFQQWFSNPLGKAVESAGMDGGNDEQVDEETRGMVSKLHTLLRPYLLRRLKMEVEKEMPNKYEHVIRCRLSKRQKFLYNDFMSRAKTRDSLASGNYLSIINCLMQLRKVCNHPDLFEQRPIVTSFTSSRSAVADFEIKELLVRRTLLQEQDDEKVNLDAVNLRFNTVPRRRLTPNVTRSLERLDASANLPSSDTGAPGPIDTWSVEGYKSSMSRQRQAARASKWKQVAYVNHLRCQAKPGRLFDLDSVQLVESLVNQRRLVPKSIAQQYPREHQDRCDELDKAILSHEERRQGMQEVIDRFAFVTPRAVANDMNRWAMPGFDHTTMPMEMGSPEFDTLHQPAVKLQIAFPDASLLQYDCGKLQELAILMQRCKAEGHRILIFTQMTKILDILEIWLSLNGFKYLRLDGSTKVEDRQALTERYNRDDRITAFILSTRSGGLGINLTGANMVLFWDLDWNFQIEAQCMDRAHRIGQTRDVHIYRFVSEHTIEENMLKKSNEKRMLDNMVIQNGQFTTEGLSKMSWIESMFDEGGKTIAGVQVGSKEGEMKESTNDRGIENAMDQAEDEEDANAAKVARAELHLLDDDFQMEMNQDKQSQQPPVVEVMTDHQGTLTDDQTAVVPKEAEERLPDEEGIELGTYGDYMLKRVDEDWEYFVNL
ncbi:hypothetical protein CBS101457_006499 [Exobasidium rhododendri]|nr:hypothetical protein CBS101457_006499 [Exobasidium rhododendri]